MGAQRFLTATILGGVTLFLAGFLIFGLALANAYPVSDIDRAEPLLLWLLLAQFGWAALLTVIIGKSPGASTPGGGFKVAALIGFLVSASFSLEYYSMTTLPVSTMTYVDPFLWAIYFGIGGGVIGLWVGKGSRSAQI